MFTAEEVAKASKNAFEAREKERKIRFEGAVRVLINEAIERGEFCAFVPDDYFHKEVVENLVEKGFKVYFEGDILTISWEHVNV